MLRNNSDLAYFPSKGRLIPSLKLTGPKQMAIDVMLLEEALQNSEPIPTVRFYKWKTAYLSLGKNQTKIPERWENLVKEEKLKIVRRPSGGNAVLHGSGITYSLIWPFPPKNRREAYKFTCEWLKEGFKQLGIPLGFGEVLNCTPKENCFATNSSADLIDKKGFKRVGSAQLWRKGRLLQHGEVILYPPKKLWEEVFDSKAPEAVQKSISQQDLEKELKKALLNYWNEINWIEIPLSEREFKIAEGLEENYTIDIKNS